MTYTQPLLFVFLLMAIVGLVQLRFGKKPRLVIAGVAGILIFSWPPLDWLFSRPLEQRYPIRPFPPAPAEAIVVLASSVLPPIYERPYAVLGNDTYQRCEFAAWLHKHWQPLPVLACGGPGSNSPRAASVAMREMLERAGVPGDMIWTEERSQSTHENAVFGAELLCQHGISRIALVVDAQSMLRAEACFRKQGVIVVPAPSEFREFEYTLDEFLPSWKAVKRNEGTLHETAGLAWYWLRRWI
jgi:uncharacterized SAM-binding protein YcdF (DUF218 family)